MKIYRALSTKTSRFQSNLVYIIQYSGPNPNTPTKPLSPTSVSLSLQVINPSRATLHHEPTQTLSSVQADLVTVQAKRTMRVV